LLTCCFDLADFTELEQEFKRNTVLNVNLFNCSSKEKVFMLDTIIKHLKVQVLGQ